MDLSAIRGKLWARNSGRWSWVKSQARSDGMSSGEDESWYIKKSSVKININTYPFTRSGLYRVRLCFALAVTPRYAHVLVALLLNSTSPDKRNFELHLWKDLRSPLPSNILRAAVRLSWSKPSMSDGPFVLYLIFEWFHYFHFTVRQFMEVNALLRAVLIKFVTVRWTSTLCFFFFRLAVRISLNSSIRDHSKVLSSSRYVNQPLLPATMFILKFFSQCPITSPSSNIPWRAHRVPWEVMTKIFPFKSLNCFMAHSAACSVGSHSIIRVYTIRCRRRRRRRRRHCARSGIMGLREREREDREFFPFKKRWNRVLRK